MYLQSVELRDWRSYRKARFDFPAPKKNKNVILIKAPNGHGKTSLFEAITLCLFGRDGLALLPRAKMAADGEYVDKLAASYGRFLSGVLHRNAIPEGRQSCSVTTVFGDVDGEIVEIQRRWHFRPDGTHKVADDDLMIFEGEGRKPVSPHATVVNREEWYRDYIAQSFLVPSLAEFFLFDGEQVQRYAAKGMAAQVRMGIEGLLGLPLLKTTRETLDKYATERRASVAAPSDSTVALLKQEIDKLEESLKQQRREYDDASNLLPALLTERDELIAKIGGGAEGTVANLQELLRAETSYGNEAERITNELIKVLATDISIAVCGAELRESTLATLLSEQNRESWESGRKQGNANLERYLTQVSGNLRNLEVISDEESERKVLKCLSDAWEALWFPAPDGCAEIIRHVALSAASRTKAIERIQQIALRSENEVAELIESREGAVRQADKKRRERQEAEQRAPESETYGVRLAKLGEEIGTVQAKLSTLENSNKSHEGELSQKRQEFGRYTDKIHKGGPDLRRAELAERASVAIGTILQDAVPSQVGELAQEMTRAWKSMAHLKERVDRIEITPDCEVKMITRKGENIHDIEKSAGESQVFTQSLIVAVTKVSQRDFPFVVDTPLARLSKDQRLGVLKTFCDREGQVILLATDTEVVGEERDVISGRIQAAFDLKVAIEDGIVVTSVHRASN